MTFDLLCLQTCRGENRWKIETLKLWCLAIWRNLSPHPPRPQPPLPDCFHETSPAQANLNILLRFQPTSATAKKLKHKCRRTRWREWRPVGREGGPGGREREREGERDTKNTFTNDDHYRPTTGGAPGTCSPIWAAKKQHRRSFWFICSLFLFLLSPFLSLSLSLSSEQKSPQCRAKQSRAAARMQIRVRLHQNEKREELVGCARTDGGG